MLIMNELMFITLIIKLLKKKTFNNLYNDAVGAIFIDEKIKAQRSLIQ